MGRFLRMNELVGTPGVIRTPDPLLRRQVLYPAELRAHAMKRPGGDPISPPAYSLARAGHAVNARAARVSNSAPAGFRFRRGPEGEAEERQWGAAIHRSPSDPDARVGVVHLRLGKGGAGGWGSEGRSSPAGPAIGGPPGPSGTVLTGGSVGEQGLIEVTDPILHQQLRTTLLTGDIAFI